MSPRRRKRSPFWTTTLVVGVLALLASGGLAMYGWNRPAPVASDPLVTTPPPTPVTPSPSASPTPAPDLTYAAKGPGTYIYASGTSAVFGTAGALKKYRVAIETGTPVPLADFAAKVDTTLADPRSWIAGKNVRLQRVSDSSYSFTVYLVTPGTAQKLCGDGGFDIVWHGEPYTSCRVGGRVVINIARYLHAIPDYGAPLEVYQQYAVNHEVGHALGHGHELCPGKGKLAPTMQQQTFGLQGCIANPWPYVDGKRYAGPPGRIVPTD